MGAAHGARHQRIRRIRVRQTMFDPADAPMINGLDAFKREQSNRHAPEFGEG